MGIYTIPEISSVGDTEETLEEAGRSYVVGRASLTENARANLIGEAVGFLKLIADAEDGRLLGVHCIGPHASELVHTGQAVMAHGGDLNYFVEAVFNYPTLGEAYKYAAFDALVRCASGARVTSGPSSGRRRARCRRRRHLIRSRGTSSRRPLGSMLSGTASPADDRR